MEEGREEINKAEPKRLIDFFASSKPLSPCRKVLCWIISASLFVGLFAVGYLCAAPEYYFSLAVLAGALIFLGDRFFRCIGILFLVLALVKGIEDYRSSCDVLHLEQAAEAGVKNK